VPPISDDADYVTPRATIDACSLISYALGAQQTMMCVVAHWRAGDFVMLTSPTIRDEVSRIAESEPVQGVSAVPLGRMAFGLERFAEPIPGPLTLLGPPSKPVSTELCAALSGEKPTTWWPPTEGSWPYGNMERHVSSAPVSSC
jgi:hypothetical protein